AMTRRRRTAMMVAGSLVAVGLLAVTLAGRRDAFAAALATPAGWVLAVAAALQIVALLARSEAWHRSIEAAGGHRRASHALPRLEHAGPQRPAQRTARCRGAHRRARLT